MAYQTFLENSEPGLISLVRDNVAKACEASALAAAGNKQLQPHDARIYYIDLGDGNVTYYLNEEADAIIKASGSSIASAQTVTDLPGDAVNLLFTHYYRQ